MNMYRKSCILYILYYIYIIHTYNAISYVCSTLYDLPAPNFWPRSSSAAPSRPGRTRQRTSGRTAGKRINVTVKTIEKP